MKLEYRDSLGRKRTQKSRPKGGHRGGHSSGRSHGHSEHGRTDVQAKALSRLAGDEEEEEKSGG